MESLSKEIENVRTTEKYKTKLKKIQLSACVQQHNEDDRK
jgi:hypothetical protein